MIRHSPIGQVRTALSGLALLLSLFVTSTAKAQTFITPLGLTPGEWDFQLKSCVFLFIDCTGRFRVYASPSDAPSMSPVITLPNPFGGGSSSAPPPVTTVAGWDAFRLEVPASPTVPGIRTGPPPSTVETVATTFGTAGMPRSIYFDGVDDGFLDWPDVDYFRSDDYSELRVGFPPETFSSAKLLRVSFQYTGQVIPIVGLPVVRWSSALFTGQSFEYYTGVTYLKSSTDAEFSPDITDFTELQALAALRSDILDFLGLPSVAVGNPGLVAADPFHLMSRETLLGIVRDIDSGAARYDGGFRMPVRDDLDTFLPPPRSVPEPSALALLAVGALLVVTRRRIR